MGDAGDVDATAVRRAAGVAMRSVANAASVALALPAVDEQQVRAVVEGAMLGGYSFDAYKSGPDGSGPGEVVVLTDIARTKGAQRALEAARIVSDATTLARDWVNTPPGDLTPELFADAVVAEHRSRKPGRLKVTVVDDAELRARGFGGIVGVGQGSVNPPRMVTLTWNPPKATASVALVGKGITFDSGGLNLKPATGMLTMKSDMAGAAAVAATVFAAAELGLPVKVTGYLCLAENMPSGTAQRPSDVVTMRNGTTVEILDTDAEGRMVLGDGICLAGEAGPDAIVDIATLTGAQVVALGGRVAGIMANDDTFRDRVRAAADGAGEAAWPMPLPADLRSQLDSSVADLAHKGERWGGMLTAGLFLKEFVTEGTPWAHVDIAGPSYNEGSAWGYTPKGATGYGVGTLLSLVEGYAG